MVIDNYSYSGRFRMLRKRHELTIDALSAQLGYSPSSWANWEQGRSSPTGDILWDVADFFGVTVDYLIGRTDENDYYRQRYKEFNFD